MIRIVIFLFFVSFAYGESDIFLGELQDGNVSQLLSENTSDIQTSQVENQLAVKREHLKQIFSLMQEQKEVNSQLYIKLHKTKNPQEKEKLQKDLRSNQKRLFKLEESFNEIAINGLDIDSIDNEKKKEKKSFQDSLMEVFEPLIISLKRATEHPRQIEKVRAEILIYESKLPEFTDALNNLDSLQTSSLDPSLQTKIALTQEQLRRQKILLTNHLSVLKNKLSEYESYESSMFDNASDGFFNFLKGRGLNILLALSGFTLTLSLLMMLRKKLQNHFEHLQHERNVFLLRVLQLGLGIFSVIMAITIALVIFYVRADWLMLAISFLLILGIGWSLKSFLPGFLDEAKLILNMGIVREEERVVYLGIPWKVQSIGMIAILNNPDLTAGEMRITLDTLKGLNSRPIDEKEPWFPTREGDYILMNDGTYGQVVFQSPEIVSIRTYSTAIRSFSTERFIDLNPTNISQEGFGIFITISISYEHQNQITSNIRLVLENSLRKMLANERFTESFQELKVEFKEATPHSLDLQILSTFDGSAANDYNHIKRVIRRNALDICNENGWILPYTKMQIDALSLQKIGTGENTTKI